MTHDKPYNIFQDINGDWCARSIMGVIIGIAVLILSFITVIYGMTHVIHSANYIAQVIIALIGLVATLLGVAAFAKQRNDCGDAKNE